MVGLAFKQSLVGQYHAALSMLKDCVSRCLNEQWEGNVGNFPFWHVAYHTLYLRTSAGTEIDWVGSGLKDGNATS